MSAPRTFRRLVLMSEDTFKSALRCLEKDALAKTTERTLWYEKNASRGTLRRLDVPIERRMDADYATDRVDTSALHVEPDGVGSMDRTVRAEQVAPVRNVLPPPPIEHADDRAADPDTLSLTEEAVEAPPVEETRQMPTSNRKELPEQYRKKYDALYRKLRLSEKIQVDRNNQVIINGRSPIQGSNFHHLMRSMFVSSAHSENAVGRREFLDMLKSVGVQHSEVSSKSARLVLLFGKPTQAGNGRFIVAGSATMSPPGKRARILRVY